MTTVEEMRARIDADEHTLHAYWPEGSMGRAWTDFGVTLRRLGVEVLTTFRILQEDEMRRRIRDH